MNTARRALRTLAALLPLGALSISTALAAAPGKPMTPIEAGDDATPNVSQRLSAIRDVVSSVTSEQTGLQPGDPNIQKAWWGNWGPRFWANWHPGWGNGGWGNGGWHNWHNWHNGWGNGGWHNFWRNW